jgi:branched-subunit amino acid permease
MKSDQSKECTNTSYNTSKIVRREAVWQKTFLVTTLILFMMTMISTTLLTKEAYSQTQNPPAENKIIRNFQTMDLLAGQINEIANLTMQNPSPSQMENATLQISTKAYGILQLSNEITIIQSDL